VFFGSDDRGKAVARGKTVVGDGTVGKTVGVAVVDRCGHGSKVVLHVDGLGYWDGHVVGLGHGIGLGHGVRLGHGIRLRHVLVVDGGHLLGLVDGLGHGHIVGLLVDLEFGTNLGDLGSVGVDGAAESLDGRALDQDFRGGGLTGWHGRGDVKVEAGVGDGGCHSDRGVGIGHGGGKLNRLELYLRENSLGDNSSVGIGHGGRGREHWQALDIDLNWCRLGESLGHLTNFSINLVARDCGSDHGCW